MFREINDEFTEKVTFYYKHIQLNNNVSNVLELFNSQCDYSIVILDHSNLNLYYIEKQLTKLV